MFKFKNLKLRNKIVLIIIVTFIVIGALTVYLIYPNIRNPLLEKQIDDSNNFSKELTQKIFSSYSQNNYYIDKIINSKLYHETRIIIIRVSKQKSAKVIADNLNDISIENCNLNNNHNILGKNLTKLIINSNKQLTNYKILDVQGKKFIVTYSKFTSFDLYKDQIVVLTIKNINFLYESINSIFIKLISILIMYSIFVILLIILLIDYILNPLNQLQTGIYEIRKGNLGYNVKIESKDEFEQIGTLFNEMSEQLLKDDVRKKDFIASSSHELKTPIAGIKTMCQLLMTTKVSEDQLDFLNDINNLVDRMNNVISDLLILSELQDNNILNKSEIYTESLIKDSLDNLKFLAENKNIKINLDIENFKVNLDILKFERVIINLVDNAIKYSNTNSYVCISCKKETKYMILKVSDNGIGIPKDSIDKIFQRFYRVDKARSRKTGGTGLGLSIVKEIVEFHNGTIEIESHEEKGTTFTITLPIR